MLHDDISDGAETIRLLLKSADGSVTIGSAVVVLRESNLFASPRNVYPGGLLKVRGRFDVTQPLFVRITDYSGNNIRIRASRVSKRKAVVSVPCLINAETGELSAGKVVIQAEQGERVLGPSGFTTIAEAAETGEAAGAFTLEFIKVVRETLALAQSRWLAIEAQSLAAVDASELRGALLAMDTELQSLESDLQAMINGVVTSIPLCTIGTAEYVLDATSLAMLDRMLVASAFEGKFRPSSIGIASFRAAAETFSTAALPELDPIGDFHDEFNPTLKEKIAELFGFFSGWNEQAKTQTTKRRSCWIWMMIIP